MQFPGFETLSSSAATVRAAFNALDESIVALDNSLRQIPAGPERVNAEANLQETLAFRARLARHPDQSGAQAEVFQVVDPPSRLWWLPPRVQQRL